jgi:hypothetical protein
MDRPSLEVLPQITHFAGATQVLLQLTETELGLSGGKKNETRDKSITRLLLLQSTPLGCGFDVVVDQDVRALGLRVSKAPPVLCDGHGSRVRFLAGPGVLGKDPVICRKDVTPKTVANTVAASATSDEIPLLTDNAPRTDFDASPLPPSPLPAAAAAAAVVGCAGGAFDCQTPVESFELTEGRLLVELSPIAVVDHDGAIVGRFPDGFDNNSQDCEDVVYSKVNHNEFFY